jgi:DDE_Tnp_1-associated
LLGQSCMPAAVSAEESSVGLTCEAAVSSAAQQAVAVLVSRAGALSRASGGSLMEGFAAVPDPRDPQGVRHGLSTLLGLCTAAALSGAVTLVEITAWVRAAPVDLLAALRCRRDRQGRLTPPHRDTIERVFTVLDAQRVAEATGAFLAERAGIAPVGAPIEGPVLLPGLAVDGKAVRNAIGPDGQIPYLGRRACQDVCVS